MKDLVIFGTGKIAECVSYYFEREREWRIVAYCCDRSHMQEDSFLGHPVIAFEDVKKLYPPVRYLMFVALGYHGINSLRRTKYEEALNKGYDLASYVSPSVYGKFLVGNNSLILDDAVIQPFVSIGNDVFIWGGAMIGHHAVIRDHSWITGSANVGGLSDIGEACFLGMNATIGPEVKVGAKSLLGANSLVTKCVPDNSVIIVRDTEVHRLDVDNFLRLTSSF